MNLEERVARIEKFLSLDKPDAWKEVFEKAEALHKKTEEMSAESKIRDKEWDATMAEIKASRERLRKQMDEMEEFQEPKP